MANDNLEHYVPIQVENLLRWAESKEDHVNQRPSICKVPSLLRDISPDSFKPRLVSIGPLHKQDKSVQDIERLKSSYLYDLLNRSISPSNQPKTVLKACLQKVNASIGEIKSSYSATNFSDDELANMMVMDGCFILEFCLKDYYEEPPLLNFVKRYDIAVDLMLLENQIPFFVLQYIFDLTNPDPKSLSLTSLLHKNLLRYVHRFYPSRNTKLPDEFSFPGVLEISNHKHVLDCLHKIYHLESSEMVDDCCAMCELTFCKYVWNMCGSCCCHSKKSEIVDTDETVQVNYNHSAVELARSGVNFKPQKEKNKAMAMKFMKGSSFVLWPWMKPTTLVMPTLLLDDLTELVLRNFIAYEQISPEVNYFFTSYLFVLDKLINNQTDVGNLVASQVLVNDLGSDEEAAMMFNNICKNIELGKFYYTKEMQALDEYYNSFWPSSFAHLRRTYFNSPWNMIALLAGITLFALTVVQTIYTVMSYNHP